MAIDVVDRIVAAVDARGPFNAIGIVGVDGPSGSGKSRLARDLSEKTPPRAPVMIFEGVTCTRRQMIGRLTYAIWIDAPASLRLARGLARDRSFAGAERLWRKRMAEEERFFASDGARDRADLVIDTAHHR